MICKLEIYNGELNIFPVITNERVFAQITMGNIVKGSPGKSPIIGENDNWWVYNNETGEYEDTGKVATTSGDVVKYVEAKDEQHPNRKAIQLNNGDLITGVAKKEGLGSVNIAMVNEWDVVDLGTSELPINLNTPKGVRPTVQEAGQTGEEANQIAYLSDLDSIGGLAFYILDASKLETINTNEGIKTCLKVGEIEKVIDTINKNGLVILSQISGNNKTLTVLSAANITFVDKSESNPKITFQYTYPINNLVVDKNYLTLLGNTHTYTIQPVTLPNGTIRHYVLENIIQAGNIRLYKASDLGNRFLAGDGTYKDITLPSSGSDLEVIKLSWIFNSSPSVLIEQLYASKEETDKLFKAIDDKKPFIFVVYNGFYSNLFGGNIAFVWGKFDMEVKNVGSDGKPSELDITMLDCYFTAYGKSIEISKMVVGTFQRNNTSEYYLLDQSYNSIGFITNGDGTKFLSDDGSYKTITPTISEVKSPILVISTEKKLSSSSMTELSDYIKPEVQSGQIPIELFLNCIYCLNVEAGQTPIYTKPYTVLPNTFEQVAVIKVMVPDIVNKKFNEVTINIDQATRAITVNETVTLSDM